MISKQQPAYPLRMSNDLREWVRVRAFNNRCSINTELNTLLEMARETVEKEEDVEKLV